MSYKEAIWHVKAGGNVFARSKHHAYVLAVAVGDGSPPIFEWHHEDEPNYFPHYHASVLVKKPSGKREYEHLTPYRGHIFYYY